MKGAVGTCSSKKVFLKTLQNLPENNCDGVFLNTGAAWTSFSLKRGFRHTSQTNINKHYSLKTVSFE